MEMRILLDTNRYSDYARGIEPVITVLENARAVAIPFVVLAELQIGFLLGQKLRANEILLAKFLKRPGVNVMYADSETVRVFAAIHVQLRRQGTPIPLHDMWIASLALQHSFHLYARDGHFDHLPQLLRV